MFEIFKIFNKKIDILYDHVKLLSEDVGSTIFDICLSNIFGGAYPQIRETKQK